MGYPGVIFDLDGTLANTLQDLAGATNFALGQLDMPTWPLERYKYMVGDGRAALCRRALPPDRQDLTDQLCTLMTDYYTDHCFDNTHLYPGIEQMLISLRQINVKLGVLSNKPQAFVDLTVRKLLGTIKFDAVIGDNDHIARKPDPAGALMVAGIFALPPEAIAYVGDTSIDMTTANRAGMVAVGATWGFRDREELARSGARTIVDTTDQLGRILFNAELEA